MRTLHVISHTHWDREWYQTFQQFRLKLVQLVDNLLEILERDPDYKYFMLDGQTIVLDDYLEIRPEQEQILRAHIQSGRIVIGPWHILPDMFLVGPEAHIRNLLEGAAVMGTLLIFLMAFGMTLNLWPQEPALVVLGMISIRDIMDDIIANHELTIAQLESYIHS